jgi:hypothetical protein
MSQSQDNQNQDNKKRKRKTVDELHAEWMKNPAYRAEYEALEEEYTLTNTMIRARALADLTPTASPHLTSLV